MGVESATYVNDLDSALPAGGDAVSQGDDHLRLLKAVAKTTFPDASRAYRLPVMTLLTGDRTLANVNTVQNLFGSSEDVFTAAANTTYEMQALYNIQKSAGTTAHDTTILFGGTATFTSFDYFMHGILAAGSGGNDALLSASLARYAWWTSAAAKTLLAAASSAVEAVIIQLNGIIRVNGAGTIIPQFQYSVAPGGAPTIYRNSYFRLHPLGVDTIASVGAWT